MFVPPDLMWLLFGLDSPVSLAPVAYFTEQGEDDESETDLVEDEDGPGDSSNAS